MYLTDEFGIFFEAGMDALEMFATLPGVAFVYCVLKVVWEAGEYPNWNRKTYRSSKCLRALAEYN